MILKPGGYCM